MLFSNFFFNPIKCFIISSIYNDAPEPQLLIFIFLLIKNLYNYIYNDFVSSYMIFLILISTKSYCHIRKFYLSI